MKKYTTDTSYLIDKIFYLFMPIGFISYLIYKVNDSEIIFYGGFLILSILILIMIRLISKYASFNFTESNIVVTYSISRKTELINYSNITEFQHISGFKQTSLNVIKYKPDGITNRKIKSTTVASSTEYIDFVKWLKNKNNSIEFSFFPSDSNMKTKFLKEFGQKTS